jgi:hypothetical protein
MKEQGISGRAILAAPPAADPVLTALAELRALQALPEPKRGESYEAECAAERALFEATPTTRAGAAALIRAAADHIDALGLNDKLLEDVFSKSILAAVDLLAGPPAAEQAPASAEDREALLDAYSCWLDGERRWLAWERAGGDSELFRQYKGLISFDGHRAGHYHGNGEAPASSRAEAVLAAVGCDWREREA